MAIGRFKIIAHDRCVHSYLGCDFKGMNGLGIPKTVIRSSYVFRVILFRDVKLKGTELSNLDCYKLFGVDFI